MVESAGGRDRELQALVADLAGGADGLGLGRLGVLAGLGEEPLGVEISAGGLVQPRLPAAILNHAVGLPGSLGLGGVAVGGAQRPQDLPHPALADPDQAGDVAEFEALAALGLPQPPELLDPLGAGQGAAAQRAKGAAHIVLAHPELLADRGRVEWLAVGEFASLVALLDALQRPPRRAVVLDVGSAAVGVGGLQRLQLLGGWPAVAGRFGPEAGQPPVALLAGAEGVEPLAGDGAGGADLPRARPGPAVGRRRVRGSGRRR